MEGKKTSFQTFKTHDHDMGPDPGFEWLAPGGGRYRRLQPQAENQTANLASEDFQSNIFFNLREY